MGESQNQPFQLFFNKFLRVDFQGSRVTSNSGVLLVRELDERFDLPGLIQNHLVDSRTGRNRQFPLADLFWQEGRSNLRSASAGAGARACFADRPPGLFSRAEENRWPLEPAFARSTGEGSGPGSYFPVWASQSPT